MNVHEYNRSVIGRLWTLADLPPKWPGTTILSQADLDRDGDLEADEFPGVEWIRFESEVREFQTVAGLTVDGKLGPRTLAALKAQERHGHPPETNTDSSEPAWLRIALGEIGTNEIPGPRSNARILDYHATTTLKATNDDVPWCSSFVNWCIEKANLKGTKSAWARSWLNWGVPLTVPRVGAVTVFSRGQTSGHVAFFIREAGSFLEVLGGNQGNTVKKSMYPKSRLLGYRWPE